MSVGKSELKLALIQELGCSADDDLEAAERDGLRATGRNQAAGMLEHEVTKIIAKLDSDMDSDSPPFPDLETQKKAKFYLGACLAACATARKQGDNLRLQMEGKVMAFKHTVKRMQKISEMEQGKIDATLAIAAAIADPDSDSDIELRSRPVGVHPGPSIAAHKKKAKKKKKKQTPGRKRGSGKAESGAKNS